MPIPTDQNELLSATLREALQLAAEGDVAAAYVRLREGHASARERARRQPWRAELMQRWDDGVSEFRMKYPPAVG